MNRGRYYSQWQRAGEMVERPFHANGWTAHVTHAFRLQGQLRVDHRNVTLPLSAPLAESLRVTFASDFHAGLLTDPRLLDAVQRAVADFAPHVFLPGGDFVLLHHRHTSGLATCLQELPAPVGKFDVFGDRNLWVDGTFIWARLEAAGMQMPINESVRLAPPYDELHVCRLDESSVRQPALDASSVAPVHTDYC